MANQETAAVELQTPFPVKMKEAKGTVNGASMVVTSLYFSDRILMTISEDGRVSQWVQVALTGNAASTVGMDLPSSSRGMLPSSHFTPRTLMGGGCEERETLGHLYASQIATIIKDYDPDEQRSLLLGLGLAKAHMDREVYFDTMDLIRKVL